MTSVSKWCKMVASGKKWESRIKRTNLTNLNMKEIYFEKESYEIIGCAFTVYNQLKYGYHEKYFQRALAIEFQKKGLKVVRECKINIRYQDQVIGKYFLDFLINDQIVVECKVASDFYHNHIKQVLAYLKATKRKLGIILLFTPQELRYKRIVN